jgi:hypothetical protein
LDRPAQPWRARLCTGNRGRRQAARRWPAVPIAVINRDLSRCAVMKSIPTPATGWV